MLSWQCVYSFTNCLNRDLKSVLRCKFVSQLWLKKNGSDGRPLVDGVFTGLLFLGYILLQCILVSLESLMPACWSFSLSVLSLGTLGWVLQMDSVSCCQGPSFFICLPPPSFSATTCSRGISCVWSEIRPVDNRCYRKWALNNAEAWSLRDQGCDLYAQGWRKDFEDLAVQW